MDGIEKITGRIAADTEAEIASIQAEARRQADEITARYEAQAKREAEEIAARGRRSAEERQARLEREVKEALRRIPQLEVRFLANSPAEETGVRKLGFPVVYCHQNAFLEEGNYRLSLNEKEFDAVKYMGQHRMAFAELNNMYMTGKDIDSVIKRVSYTVSEGINIAMEKNWA